MTYYAGLDVSLKEESNCVVGGDGAVFAEGKVATEPALICVLDRDPGRRGGSDRA